MNEHFNFKKELEAAGFKNNKRKWEKSPPSVWAIGILSVAATVLYPCFFMYFQNADEANFADIVPISCWFLLGALTLCAILLLIYRNIVKAVALTDLIALLFLNFALIETGMEKIFPSMYYWHVAYILLIILIVLGVVFYKKIATEFAKYFDLVMAIVFCALILVNAITAAPTIINKMTSDVKDPDNAAVLENATTDSPNVYIFIFDEYGGYENLLHYCNFDNAGLYESLKALGFNTSANSHNETISTNIVLPNLLNMDFVNDKSMIASTRLKNMKNPYIYQLMGANGYSVNILDSSSFLDSSDCKYLYNAGTVSKEYSAEYYIIQKTAYQPFYVSVVSDETEKINDMLEYASSSSLLQKSRLFTLGYFCFPHVPWFVDENGQPIDSNERDNWADPNVYLGQLEYASKKITEMAGKIVKSDPNSVIILMSDHGYRFAYENNYLYGTKFENMDLEYTYMTNILNAVYYGGEKMDIEGLSGINTLITVMNRLFNADLRMK